MLERKPPVYEHLPRKAPAEPGAGRFLRRTLDTLLDGALFWAAAVATVVLAWVLLQHGLSSWGIVIYFLLMWAITAYLALPRIHSALSSIYVPHYFIGRTFNADGLLGDPINLAVDGTEEQIHEAMQKAGWVRADPINAKSSWRIAWGSVARKSYPEAPVSDLFLFERAQDFAYQMEVEGNPAQRHHVRFWRTPDGWLLPGGERVGWLAGGTYDRSVGFSLFTLQITHKIDENIDIERDFIVDSVLYANPEADVRVIENFSTGYHGRNGGGDVVSTDGNLPVLQVQNVPVTDTVVEAETLDLMHQAAESVGRRPMSIIIGVALSLLLFVWDLIGIIFTINSDEIRSQLVGEEGAIVFWIMVGLITIVSALNLWFAWLTYKGRPWARRILVILTTFTVFGSLQTLMGSGNVNSFIPSLVHTMLGVLLIYALTGPAARDWRGPKRARRKAS